MIPWDGMGDHDVEIIAANVELDAFDSGRMERSFADLEPDELRRVYGADHARDPHNAYDEDDEFHDADDSDDEFDSDDDDDDSDDEADDEDDDDLGDDDDFDDDDV